MSSLMIALLLLAAALAGGLLVARSLRGRPRLERRLFVLFLLLSLLPTLLVIGLSWSLSRRQLELLDSPGLGRSLESSLALARQALEIEKGRTEALAAGLALRLAATPGRPPSAPAGCFYLWRDDLLLAAAAVLEPDAAFGAREFLRAQAPFDEAAGPATFLADFAGRPCLVHRIPVQTDTGPARLALARPLDPALADVLAEVTQGSGRLRQLRLYYGRLLEEGALLALLALGAALLAVSLLLARRLAGRIGGPLEELTAGTRRVAGGDLSHRVDVDAPDELGDLVRAFNRMTAELEHSEEERTRAERVAAWQGVARRLAHEIKNPLTPIELSMHRILKRVDDPVVADCADAVLEETGNLKRLADAFSEFARLPQPEKAPVDLAALARESAELYVEGSGVELALVDWPESCVIEADSGQMRQLVGNLVKNAVEAMGGEGRVELRLRAEGDRVTLEVTDTGPGLGDAPEALFEPYATTKTRGTGLGLAVSRKIAADHGGRLEAADGPAGGAVFALILPSGAAAPGLPEVS